MGHNIGSGLKIVLQISCLVVLRSWWGAVEILLTREGLSTVANDEKTLYMFCCCFFSEDDYRTFCSSKFYLQISLFYVTLKQECSLLPLQFSLLTFPYFTSFLSNVRYQTIFIISRIRWHQYIILHLCIKRKAVHLQISNSVCLSFSLSDYVMLVSAVSVSF